ncbi:MAG: glycosyltransferase family 4 protein [Ferruginibacter sp.]
MAALKKIKVLECIRQGQIGGGETHLLSLVKNIDKTIFEPVVLSFTDGPMIEQLKEMGIKTFIINSLKPFDFRVWKKVSAVLIRENIKIIHCHGTRATSNVFRPASKLSIPLVYTIHGWSFHNDQKPLIKKIRIWGEQFLTSKSSVNIAVSKSNMLSGKKVIPALKAIVINNGIDQEKFNPALEFKDIRTEVGVDKNAVLIIFIARFTSHKQPLSLINAFAKSLKYKPSLQLLMVGEGDDKSEALEMAKKLGINNNIHFLPFRQDVPDLLAAADIFVLPSLWEGLPIGLLEAMSMGKAVIATRVDGTSEIIQDKQNGLLIETQNLVDDLTNAISILSGDENMRKQLGKNAIETVRKNFNAASMTRKIEKVYTDILEVNN